MATSVCSHAQHCVLVPQSVQNVRADHPELLDGGVVQVGPQAGTKSPRRPRLQAYCAALVQQQRWRIADVQAPGAAVSPLSGLCVVWHEHALQPFLVIAYPALANLCDGGDCSRRALYRRQRC